MLGLNVKMFFEKGGKNMPVSQILFWLGLGWGVIVGLWSFLGSGQTKIGPVAFPFMLLLAAVVAKYVGY